MPGAVNVSGVLTACLHLPFMNETQGVLCLPVIVLESNRCTIQNRVKLFVLHQRYQPSLLLVVLIPRMLIPLMVRLQLHLLLHLLLHVLLLLHLLQVVHVRGVQTYPVPTRCPRHRLNLINLRRGWIKLRARVDSSRAVPGGPVARHRPRGRGRRGLRPRRSIEVRAAGRVYDRRDRARHLRDQLLGRDDPIRHIRPYLSLFPSSDG